MQSLSAQHSLSLPYKVYEYSIQFTGHLERSYNRSSLIDKWNKQAGARLGSSWCMSFVHSMYKETADGLKTRNPLLRTASCSNQLRYANMIGSKLQVIPMSLLGKMKIKQGDIGIMKHGQFSEKDIGKSWAGHTFLIEKDSLNWFLTNEGNTNRGLTRESKGIDGVYKLKRQKKTILAIIRYEDY